MVLIPAAPEYSTETSSAIILPSVVHSGLLRRQGAEDLDRENRLRLWSRAMGNLADWQQEDATRPARNEEYDNDNATASRLYHRAPALSQESGVKLNVVSVIGTENQLLSSHLDHESRSPRRGLCTC